MARKKDPWGKHVLVEFEEEIAWVTMNRPEKRNAMSPALNQEMLETVSALAVDERCGVLVLTGAGEDRAAGRLDHARRLPVHAEARDPRAPALRSGLHLHRLPALYRAPARSQ